MQETQQLYCKILSIGTDRSEQTGQTQIRLSDEGLHSLPFHMHHTKLFHLRTIIAFVLGVQIFRSFIYCYTLQCNSVQLDIDWSIRQSMDLALLVIVKFPFYFIITVSFQLDMLCKSGLVNKAVDTAAIGTDRFPHSVNLWKKRLELQITNQQPAKDVQNMLKQAQNKVQSKVGSMEMNNSQNWISAKHTVFFLL